METELFAHRSDTETKALLSTLTPPHVVHETQTYGRNDCLIDSILCALEHETVLRDHTRAERNKLCQLCRASLVSQGLTAGDRFDFLSHDAHFVHICEWLQSHVVEHHRGEKWDRVHRVSVLVWDRYNRALVHNRDGTTTEIAETNAVSLQWSIGAAIPSWSTDIVVQLYCNSNDAQPHGYHYEWMSVRKCEAVSSPSSPPRTSHSVADAPSTDIPCQACSHKFHTARVSERTATNNHELPAAPTFHVADAQGERNSKASSKTLLFTTSCSTAATSPASTSTTMVPHSLQSPTNAQ